MPAINFPTSGGVLTGTTSTQDRLGNKGDTFQISVAKNSVTPYEINLDNARTDFVIRNSQNEVVAQGNGGGSNLTYRAYLPPDTYTIEILQENASNPVQNYRLAMKPYDAAADQPARVEATRGVAINGTTSREGFNGLAYDRRALVIEESGMHDITLPTSLTRYRIEDASGNVVSQGKTDTDGKVFSSRLTAGNYFLVVESEIDRAFDRDFSMSILRRSETTIAADSGLVTGAIDRDSAVAGGQQRHTLNFLSEASVRLAFSMPGGQYSLTDASGKIVASGGHMTIEQMFDRPKRLDIEPGIYTLAVTPVSSESAGSFSFGINPYADFAEAREPSRVEQIINERAARLGLPPGTV